MRPKSRKLWSDRLRGKKKEETQNEELPGSWTNCLCEWAWTINQQNGNSFLGMKSSPDFLLKWIGYFQALVFISYIINSSIILKIYIIGQLLHGLIFNSPHALLSSLTHLSTQPLLCHKYFSSHKLSSFTWKFLPNRYALYGVLLFHSPKLAFL